MADQFRNERGDGGIGLMAIMMAVMIGLLVAWGGGMRGMHGSGDHDAGASGTPPGQSMDQKGGLKHDEMNTPPEEGMKP